MKQDISEEVREQWRGSAEYWDKHQKLISAMFSPVTTAMVRAAGIRSGDSVLDVAGGAGEPSLTIAGLVGPKGRVAYTDLVHEMVDIAERRARDSGITNISFHQAPADSLPFPDTGFDAGVCRFGAMFFIDPEAACREIARTLKPGSKVAFSAWGPREDNPFFNIVASAISEFIPPAPEEPDAPGGFRYSRPGSLPGVLDRAGLIEISEESLRFDLEAAIPLDQFWQTRVELSDTLRSKVAMLSPDQIGVARRKSEEAASHYFSGDLMRIPAHVIIVSAVSQGPAVG